MFFTPDIGRGSTHLLFTVQGLSFPKFSLVKSRTSIRSEASVSYRSKTFVAVQNMCLYAPVFLASPNAMVVTFSLYAMKRTHHTLHARSFNPFVRCMVGQAEESPFF